MAKSNYSQVDGYGFQRQENFNYDVHDEFMSRYMRILTRRALRWGTIHNKYAPSGTLKRFIRKGVPGDRRVAVWMATSGAQQLRDDSPQTYLQLRSKISNQSLIDSIRIDLPRTFPDNIYFLEQEDLQKQLFNVLATFAHQNQDVGYCQGLNYIAGLLLLATKSEEISFWLLKVLVEQILPKYYIASMAGLLTDLDVLNELIKSLEPTVHRHISDIGMPWAMGTTKWFICLYSEVLPTETVLRIWDCLFYEGSKVLFRVAITLIRLHKDKILATRELGELIGCFRDMRSHERVVDCHEFMKVQMLYGIWLILKNMSKRLMCLWSLFLNKLELKLQFTIDLDSCYK